MLVGAQAVYLHVGDADLAVAPYTTDGDLVLDPAVLGEVDVDRMQLGALAEGDDRIFGVQVAGPAALLVAKLLKIRDRRETTRHSDKDALDVARLLRSVETADLAERMRRLLADTRSAAVAREALDLLEALFGRRAAEGIDMAIRSAGGMVDADELAVSCELLAGDLLRSLGPRS